MITYFYVNQKLNVMKSTTALLLLILMMALLNSLMSCTTSNKVIYRVDEKAWRPAPKSSEMTGYTINR